MELIAVDSPVTICIGGDRYPATITKTTKNTITVQEDTATTSLTGYVFTRNTAATPRTFSKRKDGSYREVGCKSTYLRLGKKDFYMDPHF